MVSDERSEEFRRSVKESLTGPFQANRSDGTKPGIGIERKNKPTFSVNMYIKSGKNQTIDFYLLKMPWSDNRLLLLMLLKVNPAA